MSEQIAHSKSRKCPHDRTRGACEGSWTCPGRNSPGGWSAKQILHIVGLKTKHIGL